MPRALVATQLPGTTLAFSPPQEAGTMESRRAMVVRNAAYDQVRSEAESGVPSLREYCSASAPEEGVYS